MKPSLLLACILISLLTLTGPAHGADLLGASDSELARLKKINATNQVVSLTDAELRKLMPGKWTTGRHEYQYKADGTWTMLPVEPNATKGTWRIVHHQLIEETGALIIMEASPKQIVLKNDQGAYPFRYIRIK